MTLFQEVVRDSKRAKERLRKGKRVRDKKPGSLKRRIPRMPSPREDTGDILFRIFQERTGR